MVVKIVALDVSGNFKEGKGTTGYAIGIEEHVKELGSIRASDYDTHEAYFAAHRDFIEKEFPDVLVVESYRLFGHKAKTQSGSHLETPQLIGYLKMLCYDLKIKFVLQDPSTKLRHADNILVVTNVIEKRGRSYYFDGKLTSLHERDALRHLLFYRKYKKN